MRVLTVAGQPQNDPMPVWREYASRHARTIREYDSGGSGAPNQITHDDIRRTRIIASRISNRQGDALIERASESACPWFDVPQNADLAAADPAVTDGLFDQAARLYWYFTTPAIPDVRVAKVHKALHIKRPHLYPVLDSHLRAVYREQARPWVSKLSRLEVTLNDSPPYWMAIRDDLLANDSAPGAYHELLAEDPSEIVRQVSGLSKLRLQDILAWKITPAGRRSLPGPK